MRRVTIIRHFVTILVLPVLLATSARAQDAAQPTNGLDANALRDATGELGERARERLEPIGENESRSLRAVVMAVTGRAQWRPDEENAWRDARVDDIMAPGAMVRTGRKSKLVLRVGQNATVMIARNSRLALPAILQEGQTLRTAVRLRRGRAEFKVDRVGLTNDFSVVTPSTTLAVRGTGLGVSYGGLQGTDVFGANTNGLAAIEVRYFLARYAYFLSGRATTNEARPNPVLAQLFKTFGPPRLLSVLIEDPDAPVTLADTLTRNPLRDDRRVDEAQQNRDDLQDFFNDFDPDDPDDPTDPGGPQSPADIAEFICDYLNQIFASYADYLITEGLGIYGLEIVKDEIQSFCASPGDFEDDDLQEIFQIIFVYCSNEHPKDQAAVESCVTGFGVAVGEVLAEQFGN